MACDLHGTVVTVHKRWTAPLSVERSSPGSTDFYRKTATSFFKSSPTEEKPRPCHIPGYNLSESKSGGGGYYFYLQLGLRFVDICV